MANVRSRRSAPVREPAKSERGRDRRDKILLAAAHLFHTNGFHATGIDDIGAAVGITGPGVYRHFESKQDLLSAIVEQSLSQHEAILDEVKSADVGPRERVEKLLQMSASALVRNREQGSVYFREASNLEPDKHARFVRMQRGFIADWVQILRGARPELTAEEARVEVRAVSGLLNSVGLFATAMSADKLAARLTDMAIRALLP